MKHAHSITYHICEENHFHVELRDKSGKTFATFTLSEDQACDLCACIDGFYFFDDDDIDTIGKTAGSA